MTLPQITKQNLDMQILFGRTSETCSDSVQSMDGPADIARRIREARVRKGLKNSVELAQALRRRSGKKKPGDEVVRLWEAGNHVPPYDMIELLSLELDEPGESILFGIRRDEQLREERRFLEYVNEEELALLTEYRRTTKSGREIVLANAITVAKQNPAAMATVTRLPKKRPPKPP